jgi:hypothetical protein
MLLRAQAFPKNSNDLSRAYIIFYYWGETESSWYCGHYWPVVPAPDDR